MKAIPHNHGGPMGTIRYLWQLPQHLVALCLWAALRKRITARRDDRATTVLYCFRRFGGVSLGRYVFVHRNAESDLVRHERGHCRQSLLLGPAYLPVVGLPSLLWASLFGVLRSRWPDLDYFWFYTESWANRIAGLTFPSDGSGERDETQ